MENCVHRAMAECCQHHFHFINCSPMLALIIPLIIMCLYIRVIGTVGLWFIFKKAEEPGWAAIIPVYNILIAIKVAGKPWWFILLLLIPIVNIIIAILILNGLSKNFGKGGWFTVGLFFLRFIFIAILGFGSAKYIGDKTRFTA
jgi:hypothetical protein